MRTFRIYSQQLSDIQHSINYSHCATHYTPRTYSSYKWESVPFDHFPPFPSSHKNVLSFMQIYEKMGSRRYPAVGQRFIWGINLSCGMGVTFVVHLLTGIWNGNLHILLEDHTENILLSRAPYWHVEHIRDPIWRWPYKAHRTPDASSSSRLVEKAMVCAVVFTSPTSYTFCCDPVPRKGTVSWNLKCDSG